MNLIFDFFRTTFMGEFQTTMTGDRIAIGLLVSFFLSLFILFVYQKRPLTKLFWTSLKVLLPW